MRGLGNAEGVRRWPTPSGATRALPSILAPRKGTHEVEAQTSPRPRSRPGSSLGARRVQRRGAPRGPTPPPAPSNTGPAGEARKPTGAAARVLSTGRGHMLPPAVSSQRGSGGWAPTHQFGQRLLVAIRPQVHQPEPRRGQAAAAMQAEDNEAGHGASGEAKPGEARSTGQRAGGEWKRDRVSPSAGRESVCASASGHAPPAPPFPLCRALPRPFRSALLTASQLSPAQSTRTYFPPQPSNTSLLISFPNPSHLRPSVRLPTPPPQNCPVA